MVTTDDNQQPETAARMISLEALAELSSIAAKKAELDLEFELREERIAPYRIDITKPMVELKPLISIGDACVCSAGNISAIVGEGFLSSVTWSTPV